MSFNITDECELCGNGNDDFCPDCDEEYLQIKCGLVLLKCGDIFHEHCFRQFAKRASNNCPLGHKNIFVVSIAQPTVDDDNDIISAHPLDLYIGIVEESKQHIAKSQQQELQRLFVNYSKELKLLKTMIQRHQQEKAIIKELQKGDRRSVQYRQKIDIVKILSKELYDRYHLLGIFEKAFEEANKKQLINYQKQQREDITKQENAFLLSLVTALSSEIIQHEEEQITESTTSTPTSTRPSRTREMKLRYHKDQSIKPSKWRGKAKKTKKPAKKDFDRDRDISPKYDSGICSYCGRYIYDCKHITDDDYDDYYDDYDDDDGRHDDWSDWSDY